MFFKKNAFTLAEVLITLSIVGVVAALTMPALTKNVGGAKIGPQLSKFVNTFETATETMMLEENVNDIGSFHPGADTIGASTFQALSKYMIMTRITDLKSYNVSLPNKTKSENIMTGNSSSIWQLKDGTVMVLNSTSRNGGYTTSSKGLGSSYKKSGGMVYVDLGGINGAHRAGKEVFAFFLDSSGALVPYGGRTHRSLSNITVSRAGICDFNDARDFNDAFACTGAVADNGWKVNAK